MKPALKISGAALVLSFLSYSCALNADVQLGRAPAAGLGGLGGSEGEEPRLPRYLLGADISSVQEETLPLIDTDNQQKDIFELLKNHGFNAVRLRTFVDPKAPHGYASTDNACPARAEPFGDQAHVIAAARQAKEHGMIVFLDFHYSDTWADGNSQIIPAAWREVTSIEELASRLRDYTKSFLQDAIEQGARPDLVQIGNGITSGLLLHLPNEATTCFGDNVDPAPVNGSMTERANFGALLRAAAESVRETDATILLALHAGNPTDPAAVSAWIEEVMAERIDFDIFGMSCFTSLQGPPTAWRDTYLTLSEEYPQLKFLVSEYKGSVAGTNEVMLALPEQAGLGTFYWEPTLSGDFGGALLTRDGEVLRANPTEFAEFDALTAALPD